MHLKRAANNYALKDLFIAQSIKARNRVWDSNVGSLEYNYAANNIAMTLNNQLRSNILDAVLLDVLFSDKAP
jgi:hypothetical protein